ncbi:MAG: hypothetical protein ACXWV9_01555, partial [Flavisolibacter sp.]
MIKFFYQIITCCVFLLLVSIQTRAQDVNWKKVKVLVYSKNGKGYVHDNIPSAVASIQKLGKENGFEVHSSSD